MKTANPRGLWVCWGVLGLWPEDHFWAQSPEQHKAALPSAPVCGHIKLWCLASDSLLLPGELASDMGLLYLDLQVCGNPVDLG